MLVPPAGLPLSRQAPNRRSRTSLSYDRPRPRAHLVATATREQRRDPHWGRVGPRGRRRRPRPRRRRQSPRSCRRPRPTSRRTASPYRIRRVASLLPTPGRPHPELCRNPSRRRRRRTRRRWLRDRAAEPPSFAELLSMARLRPRSARASRVDTRSAHSGLSHSTASAPSRCPGDGFRCVGTLSTHRRSGLRARRARRHPQSRAQPRRVLPRPDRRRRRARRRGSRGSTS